MPPRRKEKDNLVRTPRRIKAPLVYTKKNGETFEINWNATDQWVLNGVKKGAISNLSKALCLSESTYAIGMFLEKNGYKFNKTFNVDLSTNDLIEFDQMVDDLLAVGNIDKPSGQDKPQSKTMESKVYSRDPKVKAWILQEAKGICESCREKGPFEGRNKRIYLEVHHVIQLSKYGKDKPENVVAVCPNCHRALHHSKSKKALVNGLYSSVQRLIKDKK